MSGNNKGKRKIARLPIMNEYSFVRLLRERKFDYSCPVFTHMNIMLGKLHISGFHSAAQSMGFCSKFCSTRHFLLDVYSSIVGIYSDITGASPDCNILSQTHETVVFHTCMCSYTLRQYSLEYRNGI